jgi:uncharacterized membrane protein YheB (UPF0754 family)
MIDTILERLNLKYEDLTIDEKDTLNGWLEQLSANKLTLESVKSYVSTMKESVEQELSKTGHETKQDLFLKARLRNYLLLESFLKTPEKAKEAIEKSLASLISKLDKK